MAHARILIATRLMFFLTAAPAFAEQLTIANFADEALKTPPPPLGAVAFFKPGETKVSRTTAITYDDVLWAARMIQGEGGGGDYEHGSAVLWTVVQRAWCPPSRGAEGFTKLFRAFAQPINPDWSCENTAADAPCRKACDDAEYAAKLSKNDHCAPHRLKRRAELLGKTWKALSKTSRKVALDWALGKLPNPVPGAVNFINNCNYDDDPKHHKFVASFRAGEGKVDPAGDKKPCSNVNSLYAERCHYGKKNTVWSSNWDADTVKLVVPPRATPTPAPEKIGADAEIKAVPAPQATPTTKPAPLGTVVR